jgi:hypothetical protein
MSSILKSPLSLGGSARPSEVTSEERSLNQKFPKNRSLSKVALSIVAMLFVLVAVALGSAAAGAKLMVKYQYDATCCQLSALRSAFVSIKEKLGLVTFHSQMGQDKWVSEGVFPDVKDGFFVDVGSADGTWMSNTKALEERGWTGICIDAFPRKMQGRTCQVVKAVVFSESGKRIQFLLADGWGGIIDDTFGVSKDRVPGAPIVEFTTVTLGEILDRAKAPRFIHYMSMDIEGGEVHALKGFPFDKYQLGALTVEHNFIEPKRSEIKALLEEHGYRRFWTSVRDDFYLPANP